MSFLNRFVVATLPYVPRAIVGAVSRRYIAGVSLQEAVDQIRSLNKIGFTTTTDLLGEYISGIDEAETNRESIEQIFHAIRSHALDSTVSVKLSQMGLLIDPGACYRNVRHLVRLAGEHGNRLTLDMEDSTTVDSTLDIFYKLRSEGLKNVGMVSQAYLRRASGDLSKLIREGGGEVRLCKGIYVEPESVAFQGYQEVRDNFVALFEQLLEGDSFIGIATHDEELLDRTSDIIQKKGISSERFEYQMLLGVREDLRNRVRNQGYPLRIYVPFGEHWYPYSVRRLRENPALAGYVFRAMFRPRSSPPLST